MSLFGLTPDELALAISAWASLGAGIVAIFVKVGRVLERLDGHEERLARLETMNGIRSEPAKVVKR